MIKILYKKSAGESIPRRLYSNLLKFLFLSFQQFKELI